jgi:hypothetical protein
MPSSSRRGNFGPLNQPFTQTPSGLWTPQQHAEVVANYSQAYLKTPEHLLQHGADFYPHWNEDAEHIGATIGRDTAAGAALLAHLSPSKEAEENRLGAYQLAHGVSDKSERLLMKADEHSAAAKSASGRATQEARRGNEGSPFHQQMLEEQAKHTAANRQLRQKAGLPGTPLGGFATREIANALRVRSGADTDPLGNLGDIKLGDFGRLINDPHGYGRAPIDTHIHDLGVGRTDIPYKTNRGLTSKGRYEHFQSGIQTAQQRVSKRLDTDIPMGDFMGGIWFGHQQNKVEHNPDARKARMATETKLDNMVHSALGSQWLPEHYGLRPASVKIAT